MKKSEQKGIDAGQERDVTAMYRTGVAARLAGLPVETLRVWERRYGLSATERSAHGQRLYSAEQVDRLRLLKNLVDQGNPIGLIAVLSIEQLRDLSGTGKPNAGIAAAPIRVALVGPSLKERLAAGGRDSLLLDVRCTCLNLEQAKSVLPGSGAEVLVVELSELEEAAIPLVLQARQAAGVQAVVVLYRFSSSATIRQLRLQGCLLARVPTDPSEIITLCRTAIVGPRVAFQSEPDIALPPPRFDDNTLTSLATDSNKVGCDCPRHLAEILLMVGSFERYSARCASVSAEDAQVHRELGHAAGRARGILEEAMERLARAEGIRY